MKTKKKKTDSPSRVELYTIFMILRIRQKETKTHERSENFNKLRHKTKSCPSQIHKNVKDGRQHCLFCM